MKNRYLKGISTNILLLGIVSFLNDLSSEMIMPILPMFIAALGGAGLVVGLIGGLRNSISSILQVLSGYWSDKTGKRKIFVSSGYLTSSVFKLFLAFSKRWHYILVFAGLERAGKNPCISFFHSIMVCEGRKKGISTNKPLEWQINPTIIFIYGSVVSIISVVLFIAFRNLTKYS